MSLPRGRLVYEPLDYQSLSMRLLKVHPNLSEDGSVQCTLFHATVEAQYTCLSYMWGPEIPSAMILVNGKELHIRQNLFDFLMVARTLPDAPSMYWIDAVCIDQENIAERNHQVRQMGEIFSKATEVISWLGQCDTLTPIVARFVEEAAKLHTLQSDHFRKTLEEHESEFARYFHDNPYWHRAWITQEIILARQCTLLLGSIRIPLEAWIKGSVDFELYSKVAKSRTFKPLHWRPDFWRGANYTMPLLNLLVMFGDNDCSVPHDHVFSLLSLCKERAAIVVDYNLAISDLMLNVLNCCPDRLCICSASLVARTLGLTDASISTTNSQEKAPWLSIDIDPEPQLPAPYRRLPRLPCTFNMARASPTVEYATYYKDTIWLVKICFLEGPEHVIYWGEKCTIDMPVWYTSIDCDYGESDHRVLCKYGEGLDLSTRDDESEKVTLHIAFNVWMEIASGLGRELCYSARSGRHKESRLDFRIGYSDGRELWRNSN